MKPADHAATLMRIGLNKGKTEILKEAFSERKTWERKEVIATWKPRTIMILRGASIVPAKSLRIALAWIILV